MWDWLLVQSLAPAEVSPVLVRRSHFAVGPCLGCVVFPRRTTAAIAQNSRPNPLGEFRLPLEFCPADPSPPTAVGKLLSWTSAPYSTSGFGGPPHAGLPAPATFRLQGLVTLLTVSSLRARAGFVSRRRRSWDSPFGAFPSRKVSRTFPPGSTHLPFLLPVHQPLTRRAGPTGRGSWALPLSRVPRGQLCGWQADRRLLPWASPLPGYSGPDLDSGSDPSSSHALCRHTAL